MNFSKLLIKAAAFLIVSVAVISCQDELSSLGSEVIGGETPNGILDDSHAIVSYSKKLKPVQTNRLPIYQLGAYKDPAFGRTNISYLTQLKLETDAPKFGEESRVDSVFAYIPYYSKSSVTDSVTSYTLDSIYGNAPIQLKISESGYFLRDLDPDTGFKEYQPYYSDQGPLFESYLGQELGYVEAFKPVDTGYVYEDSEGKEVKLAPGLRIALPNEFFQQKILDKEGSPELSNDNNFKNYLRGLYFQVIPAAENGSLFLFDPSKAYVSIYYSFKKGDDPEERDSKMFKLNFSGVNVNTYHNAPLPDFVDAALESPNVVSGNESLYLRGGDGIISVVELFGPDSDGNGVPDELELLRSKKWLINEANLIFYVDQDKINGGSSEPDRIAVYDLKNSKVLIDYNMDNTNGLPAINAFTTHLGKLERGSDGKGKYYKIRITNHISNLINKDSANVPLGIVVSNNVKAIANQKLKETMEPHIENVPAGEVLSHKGTILHGNASPDIEKRLKLQIYYTKRE